MSREPAQPSSRLSPFLLGVDSQGPRGKMVVCTKPIPEGATLVVFGGTVLTGAELRAGPRSRIRLTLQIDEDAYLYSTVEGPADWVNHSCEPNAGLVGQVVLVALKPLRPGDEVCFDYATADGSRYDEFTCTCGAASCRGRITGADWSLEDLQTRLGRWFSPYLKRRVEQATTLPLATPARSRNKRA